MPDPVVQKAKRAQAIRVCLFLVGVAAVTTALFHFVHRKEVVFRHGEQAFAAGDYAAAVEAYTLADQLGYRQPRIRWHFATALIKTGRELDALPWLEAVIAEQPVDANAVATAAGIAQSHGHPEKALAYYAQLGPQDTLTAVNLVRIADIQVQLGAFAEAGDTFRKALALEPGSADLHVALGRVLAWTGHRDEALSHFNQALALAPGHPNARFYLARVLSWEGRLADSITAYRSYLGE